MILKYIKHFSCCVSCLHQLVAKKINVMATVSLERTKETSDLALSPNSKWRSQMKKLLLHCQGMWDRGGRREAGNGGAQILSFNILLLPPASWQTSRLLFHFHFSHHGSFFALLYPPWLMGIEFPVQLTPFIQKSDKYTQPTSNQPPPNAHTVINQNAVEGQ